MSTKVENIYISPHIFTVGSVNSKSESYFKKWSSSTIRSLQSYNSRCSDYPRLHFVSHHTCTLCIMLVISGSVFMPFHLFFCVLFSSEGFKNPPVSDIQ